MLDYTCRSSLGLHLLGAPEVPTVVAYLRSCPSADAASDEAMFMQRQLLAEMTRRGEIVVAAEFVEVEEGKQEEDRPAFRAAYFKAESRGWALLTAGWGAIGTGPWFKRPQAPGLGRVETMDVSVSYVRFTELIPITGGSPATVALWADYRRPQGVTGVYLCNAGADAMKSIELTSVRREIGIDEGFGSGSEKLDSIPAGMARLIATLFHDEWTFYSSYRLSYVSGGILRGPLRATDRPLNSERLTDDPSKVWVSFRPAAEG